MSNSKQVIASRAFYRDQEVIFILIYNAITLLCYLLGDLSPAYVLWAYYLQSLQVGAKYWFLEVLSQIRSSKRSWILSIFFPIHYGGFHIFYFLFLVVLGSQFKTEGLGTFLRLNLVVLSIQFIIFVFRELSGKTPYHKQVSFFAPYVRVIPMHIIIVLGIKVISIGINTFVAFIVLKTLVDLWSQSWFARREV